MIVDICRHIKEKEGAGLRESLPLSRLVRRVNRPHILPVALNHAYMIKRTVLPPLKVNAIDYDMLSGDHETRIRDFYHNIWNSRILFFSNLKRNHCMFAILTLNNSDRGKL